MSIGLLVVDVQPAYSEYCQNVARQVAQRINNTVKPTLIMWVGEGITPDCEDSVREYLHEHGARPGKLAQARFIEKDYGFFRSWMDNGVDPDTIVKVGRHLMHRGSRTSLDVDLDELLQGEVPWVADGDPLYLPNFNEGAFMPFSGFETCGGGSEQCLAEIELWLKIQQKSFKRLSSLVY